MLPVLTSRLEADDAKNSIVSYDHYHHYSYEHESFSHFGAIDPDRFGVLTCTKHLDSANSKITVHVSKAGPFSAFGDNHEISAPVFAGSVDEKARTVTLDIEAARLKVHHFTAKKCHSHQLLPRSVLKNWE